MQGVPAREVLSAGQGKLVATALKLTAYVVTEASFGADLGAEKFIDIKCRKSGLRPSAAVIVATVRAMKYHGGADLKTITQENLAALDKGLVNLERHVENVQRVYGIPCVVSINRFSFDTPAEIRARAAQIDQLAVQSTVMPLGNATRMTTEERDLLGRWVRQGSKIK